MISSTLLVKETVLWYVYIYIYIYHKTVSFTNKVLDIHIHIYLCGTTFVHKRVFNYHKYRWKEQNN